jgi:hypothetical protein
VSGISTLFASLIAGALWSTTGPHATFWAGAGFAAIAATGYSLMNQRDSTP